MKQGNYAYRFAGYALNQPNLQSYLVGVGVLKLEANNKMSGFHTSSHMLLNECTKVEPGHFTLVGTYWQRQGGNGPNDMEAEITFTQEEKGPDGKKPKQVLVAKFAIVPAGGEDGFWLISTDAYHQDSRAPAVELVSGEAVRIPGA
jgi:hypothetical protein